VGSKGAVPDVFTLLPPDDRLDARSRFLEGLPGQPGSTRGRSGMPPPAGAAGGGLVFRRSPEGRVTVDGFPDEADVCEPMVGRLDPRVARLERGRLYIEAANGAAVYVPLGPSTRPGCHRYGRLYLRTVDG
jgi:hypothetical protein